MWNFSKKTKPNNNIDTFIGSKTTIDGDITFADFLVLDGTVNGKVSAQDNTNSRLALNNGGKIIGDVQVPNISIDGEVEGDIYASENVELAKNAKITGNVYYNLLEMEVGAAINGNLVHKPKSEIRLIEHNGADEKTPDNSPSSSADKDNKKPANNDKRQQKA